MPNSPVVISASSLVTGLVLEVDGWPNRRHQASVAVGTEPLEDGSEITDHAQRQPRTQRLTGIVGTLNGGQRPTTAWQTVLRLMDTNTVVEVITEWETYAEALILSAIGDTTGRDLTFALTIQEIVRVGAPVEVPELSAAARRARARAAEREAARHRFARTPENVAVESARQARRITQALETGVIPPGYRSLAQRALLVAENQGFGVDYLSGGGAAVVGITQQGDRYYKTSVPGGQKLEFIDPDNARLAQSAGGDTYYVRQDPRIAEVTADLWRQHERALEAETYRLLEDPTLPSPSVDPFSGLPDPDEVRPGERTGPRSIEPAAYNSAIEANRATLAAGRGPRSPRGRQQLGPLRADVGGLLETASEPAPLNI